MGDTQKVGQYEMTFQQPAGTPVKEYTLTNAYVASDPFKVSLAKVFQLFAYYTPGAGGVGNTLQYQIEWNPFNAEQDPNNLYWTPVGTYTDAAGTLTQEVFTFNSNAGVAATQQNMIATVPNLASPFMNVHQFRVKAKETVAAGAAGKVRFVLMTNTIN